MVSLPGKEPHTTAVLLVYQGKNHTQQQ